MIRRILFSAFLIFVIFIETPYAHAGIKVESVRSPGGIEAWLVHEASIPIIAVEFAFTGGASQDPKGKDGLAQFMVGLLDEGAGPYDSRSFQEKLQGLAIAMNFGAGRDYITASMQTLSANRDAAFELLRLALTTPRFDKDAVERVRGQISSLISSRTNEIDRQASYAFSAAVFPNHPYGRRTEGTQETLRAISRDDILGAYKQLLARDNLKITVVGDISADDLAKLLDKTFGSLPAKAELKPVEEVKLQGGGHHIIIQQKGPQSFIEFGAPGPKRHDPDYMASYVLNHMLGGSSFSSRLYKELREKRGLTYGVYTDLTPLDHTGAFIGTLSTRNETAGEALKLVEQEVVRFVKDGPSAQELEDAKTYLIDYYPLNFDTTGKIANLLMGLQLEDFTPAYITEREQMIKAITIGDVRKAAQKIFHDPFLVVVVGDPKGIETN
jgi:zinc protease